MCDQYNLDITQDYNDWIKLGMCLASAFGEGGRNYYHRVSQYHPRYKYSETDRKFSSFLRTPVRTQISTFFFIAKSYGLTFKEI